MITGDEPINVTKFKDGEVNSTGLTVRQHFAAMFMQGNLSSLSTGTEWPNSTVFAQKSVEYADALIAELNK